MILVDELEELQPDWRESFGALLTISPASGVVFDLGHIRGEPASQRARSNRLETGASVNALLGYYDVLPFRAISVSPEWNEVAEVANDVAEIEVDTLRPLSGSEMAGLLDRVSRPVARESVDIPFDPDDYPLF